MFGHGLGQLLNRVQELLGPSDPSCLTCGRRTRLTRELPGICPACFRMIPWITSIRCFQCGRAIGCPDCSRPGADERAFVLNRSAVMYNGPMREWLAQYKYRGNERYAELLGEMIVRPYVQLEQDLRVVLGNSETSGIHSADRLIHAVTSVPVNEARLQERGFNQAEVLAELLAGKVKLPYVSLLRRVRHTDKQSFKNRMARLKDMGSAFDRDPNACMRLSQIAERARGKRRAPLRILLIDDIYTTGSTADACAHVLQSYETELEMPIEVYCLSWARS